MAAAAVWSGAVLIVAAALVTCVQWTGAADMRSYLLASRPSLHLLEILFWLMLAVGAWAVIAFAAAELRASPRRARVLLAAVAALLLIADVNALRVFARADTVLARFAYLVLSQRTLNEGQAWLAWMNLLVVASLAVVVLLIVAVVLASPRSGAPADVRLAEGAPPVVDGFARRLAFWAAASGLAIVAARGIRESAWSSSFAAAAAAAHALGGWYWAVAVLVVAASVIWLVPPLVVAWLAPGAHRVAWAVWAGAGFYGVIIALKAAAAALRDWTVSRAVLLQLQDADISQAEGRRLEAIREQLAADVIVGLALLVVAAALLVAAARQHGASKRAVDTVADAAGATPAQAADLTAAGAGAGAGAADRAVTPAPGGLWSRAGALLAGGLALVAFASPLIAEDLVDRGGSLLWVGGARTPVYEGTAPEATRPTPMATESGAASPSVVGVYPGVDPSGEVRTWTGDRVTVNYEANGILVLPSRCELVVNGVVARARPQEVRFGPATQTMSWTWAKRFSEGKFSFEVTLVSRTGRRFTYGWTYSF